MEIKVLGPGCKNCQKTEKMVQEALSETGVKADLQHVTDMREIAGYGVFATPAVVIDGEVKLAGKVPSKEEIKKWIS